MAVVSNTSPVMNLAIIGELAVLREQFAQVWIPLAVVDELRLDQPLPGNDAVRDAIAAGWLMPRATERTDLVTVLRQSLDAGESEAIALALDIDADWLLLDERPARQAALPLGLRVTGVIGVLMKKYANAPTGLEIALTRLEDRAGFYISAELRRQVLQ